MSSLLCNCDRVLTIDSLQPGPGAAEGAILSFDVKWRQNHDSMSIPYARGFCKKHKIFLRGADTKTELLARICKKRTWSEEDMVPLSGMEYIIYDYQQATAARKEMNRGAGMLGLRQEMVLQSIIKVEKECFKYLNMKHKTIRFLGDILRASQLHTATLSTQMRSAIDSI